MGGGSKTEVVTTSQAPQASTSDAIKQYVESLPQIYETQMKYAPLEAEQQVALTEQYALPLAQAYQEAQAALYPETAALQEQLAKRASSYISADSLPPELAEEYRSQLAANLGTNVGSGIGADYLSRGMINQGMNYRQYYENLGLSLAGRQPLTNAQTPNYTDYMGSYTPESALNYLSSGYAAQTAASQAMIKPSESGGWNLGFLGKWEF